MWYGHYRSVPAGDDWTHRLLAMLAALVANLGSGSDSKPVHPWDFFPAMKPPDWEAEERQRVVEAVAAVTLGIVRESKEG